MEFLFVLENIDLGAISAQAVPQDKYLHCYRCLLETKESGCILGSDTCSTPLGSSCFTLNIKNSKQTPLVPTALRRSSTFCQFHTSLFTPVSSSAHSQLPPTFLQCLALKGPGLARVVSTPAVRDSPGTYSLLLPALLTLKSSSCSARLSPSFWRHRDPSRLSQL